MRAARDLSSKMSKDLQVPWLQHIFRPGQYISEKYKKYSLQI